LPDRGDPVRPYKHAGTQLDAPFNEGGNPYNLTLEEKTAEGKYENEVAIERMAVARAKLAQDQAKMWNDRLTVAEKPDDYKREVLGKTPMFQYARKSLYWDKRELDFGPVKDVPDLRKPGWDNLDGTCFQPPCPDVEVSPKSEEEKENAQEQLEENISSGGNSTETPAE
jgi:hypothetical protein